MNQTGQQSLFETQSNVAPPARRVREFAQGAVEESVIEVLKEARIEGTRVKLPKLPDELYRKVNVVLTRIGGAWKSGRTQAHVFSSPPGEAIMRVIETGKLPARNPEEFFGTPDEVAELVISWAEIDYVRPDWWALEPEAGEAALARRLKGSFHDRIDCCEIDSGRADYLRSGGFRVCEGDFLTDFAPSRLYERILMNPPFREYILHIMKAWGMLADPGILASVVPGGFFYAKGEEVAQLRELVKLHGDALELDAGSFKASGTVAASGIVILCRGVRGDSHHNGHLSRDAHELALYASSWRENYEARIKLFEQVRAGRYRISAEGQTDQITDEMIFGYYVQVRARARKDGSWLRLRREVEFVSLREEFVSQYVEWSREEAK